MDFQTPECIRIFLKFLRDFIFMTYFYMYSRENW